MEERLKAFARSLHPDKTRLIEFGHLAARNRASRAAAKPETFDFLGFAHIRAKTRKGAFQPRRKTRAPRR